MKTSYKRGFTLIELLVVIAIIGILASIVLASLDSARKKGRDARRIADVKQIQLALELYYDANSAYPPVLSTTTLVSPGYISVVPTDPTNGHAYSYTPYGTTGNTALCSSYHLGASLETAGNTAFSSDADVSAPPSGYAICTAAGVTAVADFNGSDNAVCTAGDAGVGCYDVKP
jgi:prepilin-type N-terminal cleavage/methylation domain-containing protein